ncbi:hypothetical protein OI18_02125 [Flavihumibacter solisilvae]|uniref:Uncharacterized protein n=1 Tax=Flavihumibacter solisilvae TaxID=1349421 RepID=A0A0C1IZU2_9BACT|nr:hypothetical protein OI18_02125 [Flavihumibacter solisilvae]
METEQKIFTDDFKRGVKFLASNNGRHLITDSTTNSPQFFGMNEQQSSPGGFPGNVFVLIDGLTTSAAGLLVMISHYQLYLAPPEGTSRMVVLCRNTGQADRSATF